MTVLAENEVVMETALFLEAVVLPAGVLLLVCLSLSIVIVCMCLKFVCRRKDYQRLEGENLPGVQD